MGLVVVCDSSAGITRIRFAGRGRLALLSAWLTQAPRAIRLIVRESIRQNEGYCQALPHPRYRTRLFHSSFNCNCRGLSPDCRLKKSPSRRLNLPGSSSMGKCADPSNRM